MQEYDDYIILKHQTVETLMARVLEKLRAGYILIGQPFLGREGVYCQALGKKSPRYGE